MLIINPKSGDGKAEKFDLVGACRERGIEPIERNATLGPDGYWDGLLAWLDRAVADGFISPDHRTLVAVDADLPALLERFDRWVPPGPRWASEEPA